MKISQEFSKHAKEYEARNDIQTQVAKHLLSKVSYTPRRILDLGCGSGVVYKNITWDFDYFCGVDFAQGMLELHPQNSSIELINADFNDSSLFDKLYAQNFESIISASALQWAENIEKSFECIAAFDAPVALAIFTADTFKTLHKTAAINSTLKSKEELLELQKLYFNAHFEVVNYRMAFENTRDMFRYIKRSGVSGSRNLLGIKEMRELLCSYPLDYLEFEVVFITS